MRYVVRIAEFSESSNLRTQNALSGYSWEHASSSATNDCDSVTHEVGNRVIDSATKDGIIKLALRLRKQQALLATHSMANGEGRCILILTISV